MNKATQNHANKSSRAKAQAGTTRHSWPAAPAARSESSSAGAPPSNTAPANCKDGHTRIIRTGIDSLYLSWEGKLFPEVEQSLKQLKEFARFTDPDLESQAILPILDHQFEVSAKGRGRFPFVLRDNWFDIQLSLHASESMPMAVVQVRSELVSQADLAEVVNKLYVVLSRLGDPGEQKISRLDICADFFTEHDLSNADDSHWVTRAQKIDRHTMSRKFSGFSIALGGDLSARLYDKTLELERSDKTWLYSLWGENGWLGEYPIWRMEFQFRRIVLREFGVLSTKDLEDQLDGLWQYATRHWLRLAVPMANDATRSRWPNHPVWDALVRAVFTNGGARPLGRVRKERMPSDDWLFVQGLAGVTTFMASRGITNLEAGVREYVKEAERYHRTRKASGFSLGRYFDRKLAQKARQMNKLLKSSPEDRDPEAYQKKKVGE